MKEIRFEDTIIWLAPDGVVRWRRDGSADRGRPESSTDEIAGASKQEPAVTDAVGGQEPLIIRAYRHPRPPSRTPELLRVLPRGEADALLPAEIGQLFSPPMSATSARQKINNARKLEKTLGAGEAGIVRVTWDGYNAEGAGRYYLSESDHDTLHAYLGS